MHNVIIYIIRLLVMTHNGYILLNEHMELNTKPGENGAYLNRIMHFGSLICNSASLFISFSHANPYQLYQINVIT